MGIWALRLLGRRRAVRGFRPRGRRRRPSGPALALAATTIPSAKYR